MGGGVIATTTGHDLQLGAGGNKGHLTIKVNSHVGIGTSEPQVQLHVDGRAKITGGLVPDYDSGWFVVEAGKNYLLPHNLGTSLLLQVLFKDPKGNRVWDAGKTIRFFNDPANAYSGCYLLMRDDNTFDFATAAQFVFGADNTRTYGDARLDQSFQSGQYRIFAWKIGVDA